MAIELPPEEQVKGQDLVGELLHSLYGTRKAARSWERKWQSGLVEMNFELGTWSPAIVYCCEREVCRFVHGDDFTFVGESTQLAWTESRVDEKPILKEEAVFGLGDGDDKTVTIVILLVTWVCLSESRNQIEIEADPRHREILLAQMKLDGANTKSVATPAVKVQEWTPQMLTKLDKDRASFFRSATMRASYMSINRVDVQQATKEFARFMSEPNERAWNMLKRLIRYLVGHGRLVHVISEQTYVKAPRVDTATMQDAHLPERVQQELTLSWRQLTQSWKLHARYTKFECCRVGTLRRSQRCIDPAWCEKHDD